MTEWALPGVVFLVCEVHGTRHTLKGRSNLAVPSSLEGSLDGEAHDKKIHLEVEMS